MPSEINQVSLEDISWVDILEDYSLSDSYDSDSEVEYVDVGSSSSTSGGVSGSYEDASSLLGDIGNWTIGDDYLKIGEGSEQVGLSGEVTAADDVRIWAGSSDKTLAAFRVYESGALVATSATITGTITATSGFIGGFEIGSTYIRDVADSFGLASYVSGADDIRFWAGDTYANRATAPFRLTEAGVITATSGTIGGWTLGSTTLTSTSSNVVLDGANEQITVGANIVLDGPTDQFTFGAGLIIDGATERIHVGSGSPNILIDGSVKTVGTDTFVSGSQGWRIDYDGSAEFNNIVARGEFRTAVFVQDEIHATGGTVLINTASTLENDATTVTTPTTSTIDITDPPSGHAQIFAVGDILRIKDGSGLDNWLEVTGVSDQTTFYRYTVDKQSGTNGTFYAGTSVVKYGTSSEGGILLTSDMSNAPYIDIFLNGATPWTAIDTKVRLGWLYGITDTDVGLSATDVYGLYSDSVYLSGVIVANTGKIGGTTNYWDISAGSLVATGSGDVEIRAGQTDYNTGTGFWLGLDSGTAKLSVGDSTGDYLTWDGANLTISGTLTVGSFPGLPPDSQLLGYWAFNEGSGTAALDSTSNANDGVISTATFVDGVSGFGLDFNGTSGDVTIADNAAIQNMFDGGGFASVWIDPDSDGEGNYGRVFDKRHSTSNGWVAFVSGESGGAMYLYFYQYFSGTTGQWRTTSRDIVIGENNHVVIFYDNSSVSNDPVIYVGAQEVAVSEIVAPVGTRNSDVGNDLYVGNNDTDGRTFDGLIDEPRLYTGEPTLSQVQALYTNPGGNTVTTIGPDQISTTDLSAINATLGTVTVGTSGYIRQGQTDYDTGTGWWIGDDSGTPKFSIGDSDGAKITWDGTDLTIIGTVKGLPITLPLNATMQDVATTTLHDDGTFIGNNADGDITFGYDMDAAATDADYLMRIGYDDGVFYPFYTVGEGVYMNNFNWGSSDHGSVTDYSGQVLASYWDNSGANDWVFKHNFGSAPAALTWSGTQSSGHITTDNTNVYILSHTDWTTVRRYTISGTTITYQDNFSLASSSPDGFSYDGTLFWGRNGGTIRSYNSSGVVQQTITLSNTPTNDIKGVIVRDGRVYICTYMHTPAKGANRTDPTPVSITLTPVGIAS